MKYFLILGLISGCTPLTPAQHVKNLKYEIEAVRVGCAVYLLDPKYPREEVLDRDCSKLSADVNPEATH